MKTKLYHLIIIMLLSISSCNKTDNTMTFQKDFLEFATKFDSTAKYLENKMALAYYAAAKNGSEENWNNFAASEIALNKHYSDKKSFEQIKIFHENKNEIAHEHHRYLDLMYLDILSKQYDEKLLQNITELQSKIERKYTEFRTELYGEIIDDNKVEDILKNSTNIQELQDVWEAHKSIGPEVESDILELIKLRNKSANQLGFKNYHEMSLTFSEQNPQEIEKIFDELDKLTTPSYDKIKNEIDDYLSNRFNINKIDLMPWHYQNRFFQESPQIFDINLDKYYSNEDIVEITRKYFEGIGTPIDEMLDKSDLFPRENKNQHAFCINIERDEKDIRVLCNIIPNYSWMETMLHEYGHAIYEKYYADTLKWSLKEPAHIFTTEAIAMLFGRMASDPQWMQDNLKLDDAEKDSLFEITKKISAYQQLVFSRWAQVMYRFEKSMYENPNQDLNSLWWQIVEKYQKIKKPEKRNMPDWATKIHIATVPAYYHNYLLGEILASQLFYILNEKVQILDEKYPVLSNNDKIGEYLKENIFAYGRQYHWSDLIVKATGEKLTPKYYAKQFVH